MMSKSIPIKNDSEKLSDPVITAGAPSSAHASGITILLSDHEKFGLSEMACYHFDLIETLTQKPKEAEEDLPVENDTIDSIRSIDSGSKFDDNVAGDHDGPFPLQEPSYSGVVSLFECGPQVPMIQGVQGKKRKRLKKRIKELNRERIKDFNRVAEEARQSHHYDQIDYCHQPLLSDWPLHLNFRTRVSFAYELTRMVFCIDASPTLTSTFGNTGHSDGAICAMDRLESMVRMFFNGLTQPISGAIAKKYSQSMTGGAAAGEDEKDEKEHEWVPEMAVTVIACYPPSLMSSKSQMNVLVADFTVRDVNSANCLADKIVDWATIEVENEIASRLGRIGGRMDCSASSLRDIIENCDIALSALPKKGRPVIVLATDCRAVQCDSILNLVRERNLKDTPFNVLDLSGSHSHRSGVSIVHEGPNYLTFDADGPSAFPLIVPDDSEALHNFCKSTRGCFLDAERLREAISTVAGNTAATRTSPPFCQDFYFSTDRIVRPNALQFYTVFSLSPCCPLRHHFWGTMPGPAYILERRKMVSKQTSNSEMVLIRYSLEPIRAKGLLILRIMDGFRPREYGTNSQDNDKVSIQFNLKLELGTVLHYEVEYTASPDHNAMVGKAHVKISFSGEQSFVQMVKSEFMKTMKLRPLTLKEKACNRICQFVNWIKDEDDIESRICPLDWGGTLTDGSKFLRCLAGLEQYQLHRHFRRVVFEVISRCGDALKFFMHDEKNDNVDAERCLVNAVAAWSTRVIPHGRLYLRQLPTSDGNLTNYCLVEIKPTGLANVYAIHVHFFEQINTNDRTNCLKSLQNEIISCDAPFLIAPSQLSRRVLNNVARIRNSTLEYKKAHRKTSELQQSELWELLHEPELLALVAKRRSFFDNFLPLILDKDHTVLVKFILDNSKRLYLVQYHLTMLQDVAIARIYMDREKGNVNRSMFHDLSESPSSFFSEIYTNVKERDHKCARALRSRRNLLNIFDSAPMPTDIIAINHAEDVRRLLLYATKTKKRLRFFNESFAKANKVLEKMTIGFMLSGTLEAEVAEIFVGGLQKIEDMPRGRWFLIRYDSENLSMCHFPSEDDEGISEGVSYRELGFFTVAFADLYYYKADVNGDASEEDELSLSYLAHFFRDLEVAHQHHYATAAYKSLRLPLRSIKDRFTNSDFESIMTCCVREKIADGIEITKVQGRRDESISPHTKLTTLLSSMLSPIPGGSPYLYFRGNENEAIEELLQGSSHEDGLENESRSDKSFSSSCDSGSDDSSEDEEAPGKGTNAYEKRDLSSYETVPPIFIWLAIDGKPTTLKEISSIEKSAFLSVFLTVFKNTIDTAKKSTLQIALTSMIVSRLNSYKAEQMLERYLWEEKHIDEVGLENVTMCLQEAENVASGTISLHFYIPHMDAMVDASARLGQKETLQSCFFSLSRCLAEQSELKLIEASNGEFFASDRNSHGWCWIHVPRAIGPVSVYAFHHLAIGSAEKVLEKGLEIVKNACHRVNQRLLLETMQKSRTASDLLIPDNAVPNVSEMATERNCTNHGPTLDLPPGVFKCNITHEAFYELNRRCLPSEAIRALEFSVLKSFAVSNRRGIFVYKDEQGSIFYMRLEPREDDSEYGIAFFVYGIHRPGASITQQLDRLIKKRLMTLCVEIISTGLTKSQHFNLHQSDVNFVKSFEHKWRKLGHEVSSLEGEFYEFPLAVYDPVLVLLYFRQNISGSTFFNLWQLNSTDRSQREYELDVSTNATFESSAGASCKLDHRDFSLCYNATRFQLDPEFQAVSTLTDKGKDFSREAGTGMALIELKLLDPKCPFSTITDAVVGQIPGQEFDALKLLESLRLKKISRLEVMNTSSCATVSRLSVRIYNTTLKVEAVYRWIELTLNQALASWVIERHLERARLGRCPLPVGTLEDKNGRSTLPICKICPGLPTLGGILTISNRLPHPASKKIDFSFSAKATDVASLALNLLERGILISLFDNRKVYAKDISGLTHLRIYQGYPTQVKMRHADSLSVQVLDISTNKMILDRPMDSPQYITVYGLSEETEMVRRKDIAEKTKSQYVPSASSFLFQKVSVDDYLSDKIPGSLSNALKMMMQKDPYAFMRRIAFILTVNRSGMSALFYNLNPQMIEIISAKLKDIHGDFIKRQLDRQHLQQSRYFFNSKSPSLDLSAQSSGISRSHRRIPTQPDKQQVASIPEGELPQARKERKILKPTIVGKSVKGSAQQALLHSRARARANNARTMPAKGSLQHASRVSRDLVPKGQMSMQQERDKRQQGGRNGLSPLLQKEFVALQSLIATKSLRRSQTVGLHQYIILGFIMNLNGKELPFLSMGTILNCSTALQTTVFPLVDSALTSGNSFNPIKFIQYYRTTFLGPSDNITISKNFAWNSKKQAIGLEKSRIYLIQQIMSSKTFRAHLIHEIAIIHLKGIARRGRCRSWILTSPPHVRGGQSSIQESDIKDFRKKYGICKREKESDALAQASKVALLVLHPQLKMFMFALKTLRRIAKGLDVDNISASQLLRDTIAKYPASVQTQNGIGNWYRLLNRSIIWDKVIIDTHAFEDVLAYICKKSKLHGIVDCTKEETCLSGPVPYDDVECAFFINNNLGYSEDGISFDLYVLCCTRGRTIERYTVEGRSPFAKKLSTHILDMAEEAIYKLIKAASADMDRENELWAKYANTNEPGDEVIDCSLDELYELMSLSFVMHLSELDQRLIHLLTIDIKHLETLYLPDLLQIITNDKGVHHHHIFDGKSGENVIHIFHVQFANVLLLLDVNSCNELVTCKLIGRNGTKVDKDKLLLRFNRVVDFFATTALSWIWHDS